MTRLMQIKYIEGLWPPDQSEEGREMLMEAICRAWRSMPDEVISKLYNLQYWKENK